MIARHLIFIDRNFLNKILLHNMKLKFKLSFKRVKTEIIIINYKK